MRSRSRSRRARPSSKRWRTATVSSAPRISSFRSWRSTAACRWFANKAWWEEDRNRARRVTAAIYNVHRWANAHQPETFAILVREGKLGGDKLQGMVRTTYATTLTPAMLQTVFDFATQAKIFDRHLEAGDYLPRP